MTINVNIANDYLVIDFLQTIFYQKATGQNTYGTLNIVNNVLVLDNLNIPLLIDSDERHCDIGLSIWFPEWFDMTVLPERQDQITIEENANESKIYTVESVDTDYRRGVFEIKAYRIKN